jgi:hypothetical protein
VFTLFTETSWAYDTSYEDCVSIAILNGAAGRLFLKNTDTGASLQVPYKYGSLGTSKGAVFNYAKSIASTPSSGIGNVFTLPWGDFSPDTFPCFGWLLAIGATAGLFAPSFFDNSGKGLCLWIFGGIPPGAVLLTKGNFDSELPSAGISAGVVDFPYAMSS